METRSYKLGASDTPAPLRRCSDKGILLPITARGNLEVLEKPLVGFFCSVRCPGDVILKTYDLARALREIDVTIVGGFQSPMEKECIDLLLRGSVSVVVCPARGLDRMQIPKNWKHPLTEGRLLILSFFDDSIRRPTATITAKRNAYVAALADSLLIAHAGKGSKTEQLCRDAIAGEKQVFAIDSPDNAHLVETGIAPIQIENSRTLLTRKRT